jgi:glycosyltransferase involved in cell wall biosynthesis
MNEPSTNSPVTQLEERPLVTFALFAYNQEKYIREAVEGAFAQTYEPLEIILSDDCSTDRTFEIMQEMAEVYRGPHHVVARQSTVNRGLGLHIRDVVEILNGAYVVVAAGDDVSLATRVAALVGLMHQEGTRLAVSNYNRMSEMGVIEEENLSYDNDNHYIWEIINSNSKVFVNGAVAAYRVDFLREAMHAAKKTLENGCLYYEDILFTSFAIAVGEKPPSFIDASLINYRINPESLSNFNAPGKTLIGEMKILEREIFRARTRLAILDATWEIASSYPDLSKCLNENRMKFDHHLSILEVAASAPEFMRRLKAIALVRSGADFRIWFVRLPGRCLHAWARLQYQKMR